MRGDTRGQTLHDFALGMVIFLLVVGFVFAFVPTMFDPFSADADSAPVRADRTADHLTAELSIREPTASGPEVREGALDADCTANFFAAESERDADVCPFADEGGETGIRELAGLPERTAVSVAMYETVQDLRDGTPATHPETGETLSVGPEPNVDAERVTRAVRVVTLDGEHYHFVVRVW